MDRGIWDFTDYEPKELREIYNAIELLERYNIQHSETMTRELNDEIERREEKGQIIREKRRKK